MIRFGRITELTEDCYVQHKYCRTWRKRFECVDARYVNLLTNRSAALYNLELFIEKLYWLNMEKTERQLIIYIRDIYRKIEEISDFMTVVETDINIKVNAVVNKCVSGDFRDKVITRSYNEWVDDTSKLLVLTSEEKKIIEKIHIKKQRVLTKMLFLREKKRKYGYDCVLKVKKDNRMIEIITAIQQIKETDYDGKMTVEEISKLSNVNRKTVKRYIEEIQDIIDVLGEAGGIYNKNKAYWTRKDIDIENAAKALYEQNKKITQSAIYKITGISRTTIRKHWSGFEVLFNELNNKVIS